MQVYAAAAIVVGTAPPLAALEAAVREHLPLCVSAQDRFCVSTRRKPKAFVVRWVADPRDTEAPTLANLAAALARSLSARAWSIRGHRGTSTWDSATAFDPSGRKRWKGTAAKVKSEWPSLELDLDTSWFLEPSTSWSKIGELDFSAPRPTLVPADVRAVARALSLPPIPARQALAIDGEPGWWLELTPSRTDPYANGWLLRAGFAPRSYCTGALLSQPLLATAPVPLNDRGHAVFDVLMRRRGREISQVTATSRRLEGKTWLLVAHQSVAGREAAREFKEWEAARAQALRQNLLEKAIATRQNKVPPGLKASEVDVKTFGRAVDEGAEALARKLFALQPRARRAEWLEELTNRFDSSPTRIRVALALGVAPEDVFGESLDVEPELIKVAIEAGARPATLLLNSLNQGPLHRADTGAEVKMLHHLGFPLDAQDRDGDTPLHCALAQANFDVAKALIGLGARCDIGGADGTALDLLGNSKAPAALVERARRQQRRRETEL